MKPDVSGILKMLFIWTFFFPLFSAPVCVFSLCFTLLPASPLLSKLLWKKKKEKEEEGEAYKKWNVLFAQGSSLFCIDRVAQAAPGHLRLSMFFLRDSLPPHLYLSSAPPSKAGGSKQ